MKLIEKIGKTVVKVIAVGCLFGAVACSEEPNVIFKPKQMAYAVFYTDNQDFAEDQHEVMKVDASEQIIMLEIKKTWLEDINLSKYFLTEWSEKSQEWQNAIHSDYGHQYGDFYDSMMVELDGTPVVKIKIKKNDTSKERRLRVHTVYTHEEFDPYGLVEIIQSPAE